MSLRELYGLEYDNSSFDSSLICWYNDLIDKSYEQLNVTDISKMIRQNILKQIAVDKAIDLFIDDPFCGEFFDGDLLGVITKDEIFSELSQKSIDRLRGFLKLMEVECYNFEWPDNETKIQYLSNLGILKAKLRIRAFS